MVVHASFWHAWSDCMTVPQLTEQDATDDRDGVVMEPIVDDKFRDDTE